MTVVRLLVAATLVAGGVSALIAAPGARVDDPATRAAQEPEAKPSDEPAQPVCLGVADKGIFADLDEKVQLELPSGLDSQRASAVVDEKRSLLILFEGTRAVKVYPLGGPKRVALGKTKDITVALRAADAIEVERVLAERPARRLGDDPTPGGDRDRDGIPDALDVLIGAKKVSLNAADYIGGYVDVTYPNGDVPRDTGVCTDVVVRALRNAGVDLQKELHEDIARAPRSYPMVKKRDSNIDHRRVKTLLPWFKRHWEARGTDVDATDDPYLPGDVVFMDTFPSKAGPDHIGIVSDTFGSDGLPRIVNNWTDGFEESEMDLLGFVPVTHRFRIK